MREVGSQDRGRLGVPLKLVLVDMAKKKEI